MADVIQNPNTSQMLGQAFQQAQQQGGVQPKKLEKGVKKELPQGPKPMTLMDFIRMLGGPQ